MLVDRLSAHVQQHTHIHTDWQSNALHSSEVISLFDSIGNWKSRNPTGPFTILELEDQEIREFYEVQERRSKDFEAPKLWKGR